MICNICTVLWKRNFHPNRTRAY